MAQLEWVEIFGANEKKKLEEKIQIKLQYTLPHPSPQHHWTLEYTADVAHRNQKVVLCQAEATLLSPPSTYLLDLTLEKLELSHIIPYEVLNNASSLSLSISLPFPQLHLNYLILLQTADSYSASSPSPSSPSPSPSPSLSCMKKTEEKLFRTIIVEKLKITN